MAVLKDLIVHGRSRFINGIDADAVHANLIDANDGIFKTITTTTLDAETITTDMLTAQNARVAQTLTVDGTISTNKWEAANIANIGGNFYISPTGKSDSGNITVTKTGSTTINGVSVGVYTLVVGSASFGVTSTNSTIWGTNSKVIFTGSIAYNSSKKYPLGTCNGTMTSVSTGSGTLTGFTITGVNSPALDVFFKEQGVTSVSNTACTGYEMQISVYQSYYSSALHPIGILLTSYGKEKKQYIDIYGGANTLGDSVSGFANPSVRIGQLDGLPNIVDGSTDSATAPSGWGIYTDNGFFKGKIVANAGRIGGYIIDTRYLQSTDKQTGMSIVKDNVSADWAFWAGGTSAAAAKFRVTHDGTLYAKNAEISGNVAATNGFIVTSATTNGITLASITSSAIVLGNEADSNAYNIKINSNGILLRKYSTILNKIDTSGMHIYDNNSIAITEITDNLIKFGKNGSNQFLINSDGFKLYTVNGEEQGLGAVEFSVGATSSTNIIMYEGVFPFYTTGTNTNITIGSPWTANTDGIYTLTSVMPSSIVVTFDVKSNTPGTYSTTYSYTGTLTRSGSTSNYTGTASSGSQPTFALSYNLDDGILRIVSRSNNTNLIGQVVDNSMFEGYSFFNTNTISYGGNTSGTKNTTITLTKTPMNGTNFNVQFDWMESPENFVVGTQKTISFTRDTIYDENTLYLLNGQITYNGSTGFTFKINPVMIQDIETETETALTTTYSTDIGISISDFYTQGLCYSDANIKIYGTGKPASYTFGTRRGTVNQIGANSFTVGMGVIASTGNQVVVGTYNKENSGIFVVGNGSATAPSNALTIYKNGLVSFGDKTKNVVELNAITTNYDDTFLRIHDSGTGYGHITVFKSDGNMIIGAGESPTYAYVRNLNDAASGTTENLFLTADSHIYLYTNAGTSKTIDTSAKKFGFYKDGWADVPKGINFVGDVGTTKKPTIYTYNNKTPGNSSYTNYGCLGFRAAGKKKPYFAFWTSENGGSDIGRLYINTKEVYTDNGTNFSVDGYTYLKGTSFNGLITANSGSYTSNTITFNWVRGAGTSLKNGSSPSWGYKWGPVCFVTAYIKTTGTISAGADIYEGSINQTAFYPRMTTYGLGYIGTRSLVASLKSDGTFLLRNASSTSIPTDTELWFSFCYLS